MKQAEQQGLRRDGRVDQLVVAQSAEQGAGAVPDLFGGASRLVAGDDLDHRPAGAPLRARLGQDLADGQAHLGRNLFGLLEIVFGAQRQAFALYGRDPLGAFEIGAAIQGHDEDPLAQKRLGAGTSEALGRLGHLGLVIAAVAAQRAVGAIVGDDIAHRAVALGLDHQPALELQAGADQGGKRAGLAQQGGDWLGIGVGGQDLVDGRAQPDQTAAHRPALDLEGGGQIVGNGGLRRVIGHGKVLERRHFGIAAI